MASLHCASTLLSAPPRPRAKRSPIISAIDGPITYSARALTSYSASAPPYPSSVPPLSPPPNLQRSRPRHVRCEALDQRGSVDQDQTVYSGVYGPWTVDPTDVREVILYRSGLVTAVASFVIAASAAFLPEGFVVGDIVKHDLDFLYLIGAGGIGLSLYLIHIYVTPIKRVLQALWAAGVIGSIGTYLVLAQPLDEGLVQYVVENPVSLWFVGPLFAALTGLVFKEGLCYGKLEAGILTFIIPGLLLGHLTNLMDNGAKLSLLGVWMALFVVFAARKFQQPVKDDIGDKSIFIFNALPEEEKKALLQKLEQQRDQKLDGSANA